MKVKLLYILKHSRMNGGGEEDKFWPSGQKTEQDSCLSEEGLINFLSDGARYSQCVKAEHSIQDRF